jgi:hypothetical protein
LKQDFSVMQLMPPRLRIASFPLWPGEQRVDYVVRERTLSPLEDAAFRRERYSKPPHEDPHRLAVLFALQELAPPNVVHEQAWQVAGGSAHP